MGFFSGISLAASVALKAFTGHRGDVSGGNRMIITSLDIATFTLWLTSASGVFYWGVLECVCASDWARGVDLMEPKGWLHWKGRICLQFTQLTQQRKRDGWRWVSNAGTEIGRTEADREERNWEGVLTQRCEKDERRLEREVNRRF